MDNRVFDQYIQTGFPSGKGPFPPWGLGTGTAGRLGHCHRAVAAEASAGLIIDLDAPRGGTDVLLRTAPRFPCQDEKCLLSELETADLLSDISGHSPAYLFHESFSIYSCL
jgi:hypothetical protein